MQRLRLSLSAIGFAETSSSVFLMEAPEIAWCKPSALISQEEILLLMDLTKTNSSPRKGKRYFNPDYVGMGVSGGFSGARYGPSLMPGGDERALDQLFP